MPRVNVDDVAFGDGRYKALGRMIGSDEYGALGRMLYVWRYCTDKERHVLTHQEVSVLTDIPDLAKHLLAAHLAEEAEDGRIRIRGTNGRIEWIKSLRANASAGGRARAKQAAANGQALPKQTGAKRQASAQANPSPLTLATALAPGPTKVPKGDPSSTVNGPPKDDHPFGWDGGDE